MSFVRILVHAVWSTKNRIPYLNDSIRWEVIQHMREYAMTKGIYIDHINGERDHMHALISLSKDQCISEVMRYIKGESSFWINKHKKTTSRFEWQDDYWAVSVGISQLENLRAYIRNQVIHHRKSSFPDEVDMMAKKYGLAKFSD